LPFIISKEAVVADLEYFGVEVIDTDIIDDSLARGVQASKGVKVMCSELKAINCNLAKLKKNIATFLLALVSNAFFRIVLRRTNSRVPVEPC
jgi:hypothetical protein